MYPAAIFSAKGVASFKTADEDCMTDAEKPSEGALILYQTQEGTVRIEVLYESETFWLNQKEKSPSFSGVELPTISYHLKEIYDSGRTEPGGNS